MRNIEVGTLIKVKPNVFYKGYDLSGRLGVVIEKKSYLMVDFSGIDEPVKILRYEVDEIDSDLKNPFLTDIFDLI